MTGGKFMSEIKNLDILEDLYLQYNDMEVAMEKWLGLYQLKIVGKYEYTSMEKFLTQKVKEYLSGINLNDYDLGGVEITDEDIRQIECKINRGDSLEEAVESQLCSIRRILDEGLYDEIYNNQSEK